MRRVEAEVGTAQLRRFEPRVAEVHADEQSRVLHARRRHHAEAERSGAGDDHHVLELDLAALDGMDGAGERLNKGGMLDRNGLGT